MQKLGLVVIGFMIACGGGGDSPEEKCDALLENICARAVDCDVVESHDTCIDQITAANDCGKVSAISEAFGDCMGDIKDASCGSLFPDGGDKIQLTLPRSCSGVFDGAEDKLAE